MSEKPAKNSPAAKRGQPRTSESGHEVDAELDRRIAAIEGHTKALRRMWSQRVPCSDLLQQIAAIREAWDKAAKIMILAELESSVRHGVEHHSSQEIFAELEATLARYFRLPAGSKHSAGRHKVAKASERHRHLHRHADGTVHSHDHEHGDRWHPIIGTVSKPPYHKH